MLNARSSPYQALCFPDEGQPRHQIRRCPVERVQELAEILDGKRDRANAVALSLRELSGNFTKHFKHIVAARKQIGNDEAECSMLPARGNERVQ